MVRSGDFMHRMEDDSVLRIKENMSKISNKALIMSNKGGVGKSSIAVNIAANSIAKDICEIKPKIAFLSFSTKGSAQAPSIDKVKQALKITKQKFPSLDVDGELQADAAIVDWIEKAKAPVSSVAGKANVLIFPDLNSGNIAYKLVERLAGAKAIGPVISGLTPPVNDLSRGCSVDDIIDMCAISSIQAIA